MYRVSKETFDSYLSGRDLVKVQGVVFHSSYYMEGGIKRGYKETSSWGAETIYKIDRDDFGPLWENIETVNLISNFL